MDNLIIEVEKYVVNLLNEQLNSSHTYHNLPHTQRVVDKTKELIESHNINETDTNNLIIAAWFHDVGYTQSINNHEEESVKLLQSFLENHNVTKENTDTISKIILATKMGYEPENLLEKIIRDADSSHLADKNFSDISELLRKEWELVCDKSLTESEWLSENIKFLTTHRFYTDFASANWENRKGKNLAQLLKSQKKLTLETNKLKQKKVM